MDVRSWLQTLDLERYAEAFEENELEWSDLPDLTTDDLKEELGVKRLPDRKKLLQAIEDLGGKPPTGAGGTATGPGPTPPEEKTTRDPAPEPPRSKPARTLTGRNKAVGPSDPYIHKTVAEKYRIDAPVGEIGASGQVYRATRTSNGAAVAVKVIPSDLVQDAAAVDGFHDTAMRAGKLGAPPFMQVHEFGDADGGDKYLVTDYVGGTSLAGALAASGPMDPAMALDIAAKVATAMETAHGAGLFHGDLKPSNVLLGDADGDVRISDFGVVSLMPGGAMTSLNESDRWLTGAEYLAPEQALGEGADQRTDVYAVGVLLYEMLTGRPPFVSGSGPATLKRVIYEKPLPLHLHKTVPGLSNDLEAVVMRALSKAPSGRFNSMSDFRLAVDHLIRKAAGETPEPDAEVEARDGADGDSHPSQPEPEREPATAPSAGRDHAATTVMQALPAGVIAAAKAEAEASAAAKAQQERDEEEARSESAKTTMVLTAAPTAAKADASTPPPDDDGGAQPATEAELPKSRRKRKKRTKKGPASTVQAVGGAAAALRVEGAPGESGEVLTNRPDGQGGYAWEVPAVDGESEVPTAPQAPVKAEPEAGAHSKADAAPAAKGADEPAPETAEKAEDDGAKTEKEAATPERETRQSRSKERRAKARRKQKRSLTGEEEAVSAGADNRTRSERRRARTGENRARTPNERVYTGEFEHVHPEAQAPAGKGDDWFVSSAAELAQADLERHYIEDEGKIFGLSGSTFITLAVVGVLAVAFIVMLASADDDAAPDLRPSAQAEARAKAAHPSELALNEADANDGGDVLTGGGGSQLGFIMGKAEQAFSQGRFLPPAPANVREYIDEIRGIDPDNSFAKELEQRSTDKLSDDARAAYKAREWQEAHDSYERLTHFAPWNEPAKKRLEELKEKLGLPPVVVEGGAEAAAADAGADAAGDVDASAAPAAPGVADAPGSAFAVAAVPAPSPAPLSAAAVAALGASAAAQPAAEAPKPEAESPKPVRADPKPAREAAAAKSEARSKRKAARDKAAAKKSSRKEAKPTADQVAAASPVNSQDARRLVNEGRRMLRNAKYPDARKAFTDAINANPRSAAAHAGLGEVSFQMGRFADAVRYHRKAISLDRNNGKYHTSLANAYYKLREYARAIAHWKRALELDPSNSLARSYIRIAQQKLNSER